MNPSSSTNQQAQYYYNSSYSSSSSHQPPLPPYTSNDHCNNNLDRASYYPQPTSYYDVNQYGSHTAYHYSNTAHQYPSTTYHQYPPTAHQYPPRTYYDQSAGSRVLPQHNPVPLESHNPQRIQQLRQEIDEAEEETLRYIDEANAKKRLIEKQQQKEESKKQKLQHQQPRKTRQCPYCDKSFESLSGLNSHVEKKHSKPCTNQYPPTTTAHHQYPPTTNQYPHIHHHQYHLAPHPSNQYAYQSVGSRAVTQHNLVPLESHSPQRDKETLRCIDEANAKKRLTEKQQQKEESKKKKLRSAGNRVVSQEVAPLVHSCDVPTTTKESIDTFYSVIAINLDSTRLADTYRFQFNSMSKECEEKVVLEQLVSCYNYEFHKKEEGFDGVVINGLECGIELRYMNWYLRLNGSYGDIPFVGKSSDDYLLSLLSGMTYPAKQATCIQRKREKHLIALRSIDETVQMSAELFKELDVNGTKGDPVKRAEKGLADLFDILCFDEVDDSHNDPFNLILDLE